MNTFYFQPRNFRHELTESEGCAPRISLRPVMRCGIGIGLTVGGGLALSGGLAAAGGIASSIMSANAQEDAANTAAQSQKNANQLNYQMYQESRGSKGSAVLPTYLQNPDGSLFEGKLGSDLVGDYNNTNVPLSSFQGAAASTDQGQQGATRLTNDIFNGGVTSEMLNNAAPGQATRVATARSSSLDALHKTLDQIDASQAQRGYGGDSYANRLLSFQSGKAGGDAVGAATLTNQQETAGIQNYGNITLPSQNMTLPFSMSQANAQQTFMPSDQYLASVGQRMQPFNMLKIGYTGPFQYQPLPTPGAGAYSGMAGAMSALGGSASGAGGQAMQLYQQQQNQQMIQQYLNQQQQNNFLTSPGGQAQSNGAASEYYSGSSTNLAGAMEANQLSMPPTDPNSIMDNVPLAPGTV
jgi:hypothetical protein